MVSNRQKLPIGIGNIDRWLQSECGVIRSRSACAKRFAFGTCDIDGECRQFGRANGAEVAWAIQRMFRSLRRGK